MWKIKIQTELKFRSMTQEDLAIDANLSQSAISAFLSGRKQPSLESLEKIAFALDMTIAELFTSSKQTPLYIQEQELKRLKTQILDLVTKANLSQVHSLSVLLSICRKFLR